MNKFNINDFNHNQEDSALQKTAGAFKLPQSAYQDIYNFVKETFIKAKQLDAKRITEKSFPPKTFTLNLTGTNYQFLNEMFQKYPILGNITIVFEYKSNSACGWYYNSARKISLNLACPITDVLGHTLQHELLHFIQYTIKAYKLIKYPKYNARKDNTDLGGMAKREFIDPSYDVQGYKLDTPNTQNRRWRRQRRTTHTHRPIQYQTDLNTLIRDLQMDFHQRGASYPSKTQYLKQFFDGKILGLRYANQTLKSFKDMDDPEFYQHILKIIYKQFMNKDSIDLNKLNKDKEELSVTEKGSAKNQKQKPSSDMIVASSQSGDPIKENQFDNLKDLFFNSYTVYNQMKKSGLQKENPNYIDDQKTGKKLYIPFQLYNLADNLPYLKSKGENLILQDPSFKRMVKFLQAAQNYKSTGQVHPFIINSVMKDFTKQWATQYALHNNVQSEHDMIDLKSLFSKYGISIN